MVPGESGGRRLHATPKSHQSEAASRLAAGAFQTAIDASATAAACPLSTLLWTCGGITESWHYTHSTTHDPLASRGRRLTQRCRVARPQTPAAQLGNASPVRARQVFHARPSARSRQLGAVGPRPWPLSMLKRAHAPRYPLAPMVVHLLQLAVAYRPFACMHPTFELPSRAGPAAGQLT
ncbi:hypothetical protein BDV95DRAFT_597869 [Massariosphaeria phaeospora]|uniref:Uncharacterized protein n=1 Tax=Massariosphaeria phaeospora TaxID=100035 RepID=A0A7C8I0R9_9PLEO|nr:hypothetical protein BDV95DRAFT_597869 [Massariosphaeria phaeospora]